MLHPVLVVAGREVFAGMGAARFLPVGGAGHGDGGLLDQVVELQRFHQIGVPDQRAVLDAERAALGIDFGDAPVALFQRLAGAEHRGVFLHRLLHGGAQHGRGRTTLGVAQAVEPGQGLIARPLGQFMMAGNAGQLLGRFHARGLAEHHQVDQRIGTQAVGAMHRNTGRFAHCHQAMDNAVGIAVLEGESIARIGAGNAARIVVHRRQHRDRFLISTPAPKMPVGWNCSNSMSCRGRPARSTMALPSPVWVWAPVQD